MIVPARDTSDAELQEAQADLAALRTELTGIQAALATAQQAADATQAEANAAREAEAALQAQLQGEGNAPAGPANAVVADGPINANNNLPEIPRPSGSNWSIQRAMQLNAADYSAIQVSFTQHYQLHDGLVLTTHRSFTADHPKLGHPLSTRLDRGFPPSGS